MCPCSGHVWGGGIGEEDQNQDKENAWSTSTALIPTRGNHSGAPPWPPQLFWFSLLPLQRFQGVCVNDCQHVWFVVFRHCFNMSEWRLSFYSPWIETFSLWVSTTSLKTPSPHFPPPSHPPPPPLSPVPLKNKKTQRSEKAAFSPLFRTWLTSPLTWYRTSLVSPEVFGTSGKCVPQCSFISLDNWYLIETYSQLCMCLLQISKHWRPDFSAEGSHIWNYADSFQHGVQRKNWHLGMWPYYVLHRWRCTR